MANAEQLAILKKALVKSDIEVWNKWRRKNMDAKIDLAGANLKQANLREAWLDFANLAGANLENAYFEKAKLSHTNLSKSNLKGTRFYEAFLSSINFDGADLQGARLIEAHIHHASFREANLSYADLNDIDLRSSDFTGANLRYANFTDARLNEANFTGADLSDASLVNSSMIKTNLSKANLSNCTIYGSSVWDVNLEGAVQSNLIITNFKEPIITVDNLEIAQFIYLMLHNEKLRDVIDTIGKKAVLILGRFTPDRLAVLQAIREELRKRDYIPILFDFEKPATKSLTETVKLLANMSRFIIADLTEPRSVGYELGRVVPHLNTVAVQPILLRNETTFGMFDDLYSSKCVLPIHEYESQAQLIAELSEKVIQPAEAKVNELRQSK